jgi:N-acetylmuramoyl-L-alanine amidase
MSKASKSNIALICAVCLVGCCLCGFSGEVSAEPALVSDDAVEVYVDGILTSSCVVIGGKAYMTPEDFCAALKMSCNVLAPEEGQSRLLELGGVRVAVSADGKYMTAVDRYFYLSGGAREIGGGYALPVGELSRVFGARTVWDSENGSLDIDTTSVRALQSGDSYYAEEDVYWLSRIINAESGNQSLEGMMGVGNVVMNRVDNPSCPDTVYDVIFDTRYGVQFSPVETGGIYAEPNEQSVIAAKLCLEGYNVVGDSLYFVNPETGSTAWFRKTRTFVVTWGDHDFYA